MPVPVRRPGPGRRRSPRPPAGRTPSFRLQAARERSIGPSVGHFHSGGGEPAGAGRKTQDGATPVGETAAECWRTVATGSLSLDVEADFEIRADASRLRNLFENLFRNAVEHAGEGATVRVGRLEDGFYVADDGPGVPPDRRDAIFQPGTSTADDGTGFGLAIVGEIANAHGWTVAATESDDGGARFEIRGVDAA